MKTLFVICWLEMLSKLRKLIKAQFKQKFRQQTNKEAVSDFSLL